MLCAVCCVLPQAEATRAGIAFLALNIGKLGKKGGNETKKRLEEAQLST